MDEGLLGTEDTNYLEEVETSNRDKNAKLILIEQTIEESEKDHSVVSYEVVGAIKSILSGDIESIEEVKEIFFKKLK